MLTCGYIKKHRTCLEWRWRKDPLMVALWDFILLSANFKEGNFENLTIQRGQFVTSLNSLSFETGISIRSVRTALKKLESSGELTIKTTSKFSVLTVVNYSTYQDSNTDTDTHNDKRPTRKRHATDTRPTLIEERKKENKKEKEEVRSKLTPFQGELLLPLHLDTDEVRESILTWLQYKKEKNQTYKATGLKVFFTKLGKDYQTAHDLILAIEGSISKNYTGIFPCTNSVSTNKTNKVDLAMKRNFDLIKQFEGQ